MIEKNQIHNLSYAAAFEEWRDLVNQFHKRGWLWFNSLVSLLFDLNTFTSSDSQLNETVKLQHQLAAADLYPKTRKTFEDIAHSLYFWVKASKAMSANEQSVQLMLAGLQELSNEMGGSQKQLEKSEEVISEIENILEDLDLLPPDRANHRLLISALRKINRFKYILDQANEFVLQQAVKRGLDRILYPYDNYESRVSELVYDLSGRPLVSETDTEIFIEDEDEDFDTHPSELESSES